jgi:hypothetical protein
MLEACKEDGCRSGSETFYVNGLAQVLKALVVLSAKASSFIIAFTLCGSPALFIVAFHLK